MENIKIAVIGGTGLYKIDGIEIKEELDEFKIYADENLEFEFIDPAESPDQEVRFALYDDLFKKGLIPIETNEISDDGKSSQKLIFPGVILSYKGKESAVNLLKSTFSFSHIII